MSSLAFIDLNNLGTSNQGILSSDLFFLELDVRRGYLNNTFANHGGVFLASFTILALYCALIPVSTLVEVSLGS
jgi:hypothetical protein